MSVEKEFKCRLCGHTEYNEIRRHNRILGAGHHSWIIYYSCKGCSVIFMGPELFSVVGTKEDKNVI